MNVYIHGKDGSGWAVDMIREDVLAALKRLKINQTKNFIKADIIHNIWWNKFILKKYFYLRFKKNVVLTAINYIDLENENYSVKDIFHASNKYVKAWIAPSVKQKKILEKYNDNVFLLPYYLNYEIFNYIKYENKKEEILNKFNIPKNLVENKIIIGSFQRDSLGSDITKAKWQKGPELLIELLKDAPKDKFVLLLASARRHYVINECKKYGISYFYVGKETDSDDIAFNNLPLSDIPDLYSIADLYLVTSKSEGGPKAIQEATAMKTPIYSTDVGLAADFLNKENIFIENTSYKEAVSNFIINFSSNKNEIKLAIEEQYERNLSLLNITTLDQQLLDIYDTILQSEKQ